MKITPTRTRTSSLRWALAPLALLGLAMMLSGCDRRPSPEVPAPPRSDAATPDASPLTPSPSASPASSVGQ